MNLYQLSFRNIPVTLVYNNPITSYSAVLEISTCYICNSSTTIPYSLCCICSEKHLGFKICYTKEKGLHVINKIIRKKDEIWNEDERTPETVLTYYGESLRKKDVDARYGRSNNTFATYTVEKSYEKDIYIDSSRIRSLLSLLNSTIQPNCQFVKVNDRVRLQFVRDIDIDEELTVFYDYDKNDRSRTYQPDIIIIK